MCPPNGFGQDGLNCIEFWYKVKPAYLGTRNLWPLLPGGRCSDVALCNKNRKWDSKIVVAVDKTSGRYSEVVFNSGYTVVVKSLCYRIYYCSHYIFAYFGKLIANQVTAETFDLETNLGKDCLFIYII